MGRNIFCNLGMVGPSCSLQENRVPGKPGVCPFPLPKGSIPTPAENPVGMKQINMTCAHRNVQLIPYIACTPRPTFSSPTIAVCCLVNACLVCVAKKAPWFERWHGGRGLRKKPAWGWGGPGRWFFPFSLPGPQSMERTGPRNTPYIKW